MTTPPPPRPIASGASIGHVHLKVADIERALGFYCGVLGFILMQRFGTQAAFISAGGYHHHIGLNTWESRGGAPRFSTPREPTSQTPCAA
jgi:catechol 2,3-dioxygenase